MNVKSVKTANQHDLAEFIRSIILLAEIFSNFENWRGTYVNEWFNWYFESAHPTLNSIFAFDLLVKISRYVSAYRVVETERVKKFVVFVEGDSEFVALPPIFTALGMTGIDFSMKNSVRFINLEGKDRLQRDKIRINLAKFREDEISYFLIFDNDLNVRSYIEDLKREKLIEDGHYLIWDAKFEDNFGEEAIKKTQASSISDMGKVMGQVMPGVNGRADGAKISQIVKEKLT
jgi:Glu-tRNA(Gln) amidotransferase subunit E-like FAD-binding protein